MRRGRFHVLDLLREVDAVEQHLLRKHRADGLVGEVRALLPAAARTHCLAASVQAGALTLTLDSPAWATRARYLVPGLEAALTPSGITSVVFRVRPAASEVTRPRRRLAGLGAWPRLSPEAARHLRETADHIADPALAEVFRRLASRHQNGANSKPFGS